MPPATTPAPAVTSAAWMVAPLALAARAPLVIMGPVGGGRAPLSPIVGRCDPAQLAVRLVGQADG